MISQHLQFLTAHVRLLHLISSALATDPFLMEPLQASFSISICNMLLFVVRLSEPFISRVAVWKQLI